MRRRHGGAHDWRVFVVNVLLVNPPFMGRYSRTSRSPAVPIGGTLYYPFWLAYAAGCLDEDGATVDIIDAPAEGYSVADVLGRAEETPPHLIVVDTSTASIYSDVGVAERLKERFPSSFVTLVGTHPSALPEETLSLSDSVDAVARGEYDYTIRDLARCLDGGGDLHDVEGLTFKENGAMCANQARPLIEDVDALPFVTEVYRRHLDIRNYFFAAVDYPMVQVITGRGCPYKCFFCLYPQTFHSRRFRPRSVANVVDEFQYIVEYLPEVRQVEIDDDTFTVDKGRVREICRELLNRGIDLKWYAQVRADLDLETMLIMKEAGCRGLGVGFESGDQGCLNLMKKGIRVEQIRDFVSSTEKAGLLVHGCFIFGNPGETRETMERTLTLAKELNCSTMQFYPLQVYPGTEAYKWAVENGYLMARDYSSWLAEDGGYHCFLNLPGLPAAEIEAFCQRAIREYYLRPRYIAKKAGEMLRRPGEIRKTMLSSKTFFARLLTGRNGAVPAESECGGQREGMFELR